MAWGSEAQEAGRAYRKRRATNVPLKRRSGPFYHRCGEPTRGGGTCNLSLGHGGGHKR